MNRLILLNLFVVCGSIGCSESLHSARDSVVEAHADSASSPAAHLNSNPRNATTDSSRIQQKIDLAIPENRTAAYANHFRIHLGRNECFLDFGVSSTDNAKGVSRFDLQHRIAMNFYTAKRLRTALQMAVDRHEQAFGTLTLIEPSESVESDSPTVTEYVNFVRVSSTPEELILDCGLNPNPYSPGRVEVTVSHTIVMLHTQAKRLLGEINKSIERHEKEHGFIETDVQRRLATPKHKSPEL